MKSTHFYKFEFYFCSTYIYILHYGVSQAYCKKLRPSGPTHPFNIVVPDKHLLNLLAISLHASTNMIILLFLDFQLWEIGYRFLPCFPSSIPIVHVYIASSSEPPNIILL